MECSTWNSTWNILIMSAGSTPSDAADAIYKAASFVYQRHKRHKSKKKFRRFRKAVDAARIDRAMGSYNTSHSPLASKRSFFVPKFSHNPLRSFLYV